MHQGLHELRGLVPAYLALESNEGGDFAREVEDFCLKHTDRQPAEQERNSNVPLLIPSINPSRPCFCKVRHGQDIGGASAEPGGQLPGMPFSTLIDAIRV